MTDIEHELTELLKDATKYHLDEKCCVKENKADSICEIKIIHINKKDKKKDGLLSYYFDNLSEKELINLLETFEPLKHKHKLAS